MMNATKPRRRLNPIVAIGRWSTRHPWRAIALWLVFVVAAVGVLLMTGSKTLQNGTVGEAARGYSMLENHQLQRGGELDYGYVHSDSLP